MAAWREATGLSGQRPNNIRRTPDGAHVHLIAAEYLRDVSYEGSGEGARIKYEFEGEVDPELVRRLTEMNVSRPVAEALVADHPERIRPRSLAATVVDAVRPIPRSTTPGWAGPTAPPPGPGRGFSPGRRRCCCRSAARSPWA